MIDHLLLVLFTITIESFSDKEFTTKNDEGKTVTLSKIK